MMLLFAVLNCRLVSQTTLFASEAAGVHVHYMRLTLVRIVCPSY